MSLLVTARAAVWNDDEQRPRAPSRLVLTTLLTLVVGVAGVLPAIGLVGAADSVAAPALSAALGVAGEVVVLLALTAGVGLSAWVVDRRRLADLGLERSRAWWADLGFGLALGAALPALVFGLELATGLVRVIDVVRLLPGAMLPVGPETPAGVAFALVTVYFVGVAVFEETLFRGYLLPNVAEGLRWFSVSPHRAVLGAAAATSLLFGLGHATNPGSTPLSSVFIVLYGLFLAAGFVLTDRLAVPLGIHVTWNLTLSSVFGFPVSGLTTPVTLLAIDQQGHWLVTGGGFGPEGGLVSFVALAAGSGALAWWVHRREGDLSLVLDIATPDLRRREPRPSGGSDGRGEPPSADE